MIQKESGQLKEEKTLKQKNENGALFRYYLSPPDKNIINSLI